MRLFFDYVSGGGLCLIEVVSVRKEGVTVIYGDNGAGKSGYVRLLKRSCRARSAKGKLEPLHPNINKSPEGPQLALLEYHAGAQIQKAAWQAGQPTDALLS